MEAVRITWHVLGMGTMEVKGIPGLDLTTDQLMKYLGCEGHPWVTVLDTYGKKIRINTRYIRALEVVSV